MIEIYSEKRLDKSMEKNPNLSPFIVEVNRRRNIGVPKVIKAIGETQRKKNNQNNPLCLFK